MSSLHAIFASTSGHTEYVIDLLLPMVEAAGITTEKQWVEKAKPEDLLRGDVLLIASSTWNTGNVEGQLNPHMFAFLMDRAKEAQLNGKKVALIALGDERYRYKANASLHLEEFVKTHGGVQILPTFKVINEPYGQEKEIEEWGRVLLSKISSL